MIKLSRGPQNNVEYISRIKQNTDSFEIHQVSAVSSPFEKLYFKMCPQVPEIILRTDLNIHFSSTLYEHFDQLSNMLTWNLYTERKKIFERLLTSFNKYRYS